MEKTLGKITGISVGFGGYDDAMFGVSVSLGSGCWGVNDFKGTWGHDPDKHAKWTKAQQIRHFGETMKWLHNIMKQANVMRVADLKGVPVEITTENNMLESWRILTEVIQ